MRYKMAFTLAVAVAAYCVAQASLSLANCYDDKSDCPDNYFCDLTRNLCTKCLSCEDLNREALTSHTDCVQSVSNCGQCLNGLIEDPQGDIKCVPVSQDMRPSTDPYIFVWIGFGIILSLVIVGILVFVYYRFVSKQNLFNVNMGTNIEATLPSAPSALPPPPPYYPAVPLGKTMEEEASLIKTYQPPFPSLEPQEMQNVSMYNPPNYVRLPFSSTNGYRDINENRPPVVHDEDTMPSNWTAAPDYNDNTERAAVETERPAEQQTGGAEPPRPAEPAPTNLSSALAEAYNTKIIRQPSAVQPPVQMQDMGPSHDVEMEDVSTAPITAHTNNGVVIMLNVTNQCNTVNQSTH